MNCERCGAIIDPTALACPYCHLTTPAGVLAQRNQEAANRARQQWVQAVDLQKQRATEMQAQATATQAVVFSSIGIALCCLPLGAVGIVQGMRAKSMAAAQKMEPPPRAQLGVILGALSCVMSAVLLVFSLVRASDRDAHAAARIAELDKQMGASVSSSTIDHTTACGLAEQTALRSGYKSDEGRELDGFDCPGRLTQSGSTAQLEDFAFHSNSGSFKVFVCLKRGDKWYASELREDACATADASDAAAAETADPISTHHSEPNRPHAPPHASGSTAAPHVESSAPHLAASAHAH